MFSNKRNKYSSIQPREKYQGFYFIELTATELIYYCPKCKSFHSFSSHYLPEHFSNLTGAYEMSTALPCRCGMISRYLIMDRQLQQSLIAQSSIPKHSNILLVQIINYSQIKVLHDNQYQIINLKRGENIEFLALCNVCNNFHYTSLSELMINDTNRKRTAVKALYGMAGSPIGAFQDNLCDLTRCQSCRSKDIHFYLV